MTSRENIVYLLRGAAGLLLLLSSACATGGDGASSGFTVGSASNGSSASGTAGSSGASSSTSASTGGQSTGAASSGGSTGAATGGSAGTGGTGAMCSRWRRDVPGSFLRGVSVGDDGTVYVAGLASDTQAHVLALDPCDGSVVQEQTFIHGNHVKSELTAVTFGTDGLFVAGRTYPNATDSEGLYARLDPMTLEVDWTSPLFGGLAKRDSLVSVGLTAAGRVWMAGSVGEGASQRPWWVSGSTTGQGCGFSGGTTTQSAAVGIASDANSVFTLVDEVVGGVRLVRFDPTCTCMCAPLSVSPAIDIGTVATAPQDIVIDTGTLYGVGMATDDAMDADYRAVGVAIDVATGSLLATVTSNPTGLFDVDFGVTVGDGRLYVARTTGWDGANVDDVAASAHLVAYDLPLTDGEAPAWDTSLMGVNGALRVARDASSGTLYAVGVAAGEGVVVSCDPDGTCG